MRNTAFLLLCALFTAFAGFGQTKVIDKVVAQVGDNIILLSEIEGQKQLMKQSGEALPANAECQILENLMYQFLLVNQAELDSVQISDEQVDAEMENRLRAIEAQMKDAKDDKGNPITIESFYGKSKSQIKEEFRATIKKRLQGQEVERGIIGNISVSPREVEEFFKKIPKDSLPFINSQLMFQQITIFPSITKADKERAYKELEDSRKMILSGKRSFTSEAVRISDDPGSAAKGGRIEATRGMMVKAFEETAYGLKPGEISDIFETEYGYHIMQMLDRKGDDYIVNHILVIPEFSLDSLDAAAIRLQKCYDDLKANKISWEDAVRIYSNDPGTKENNGTILNPITGEQRWSIEDINQVDPMMFRLTDALGMNEVTQPDLYFDFMERKQGIRIVRLTERTQPHIANLKDDYPMFRSFAEEEKRNQAIMNWTKSRISTAYIRIDDSFKGCVFQNVWVP
jgi:peptidyl-prolyl cis-trans isomerase SurA